MKNFTNCQFASTGLQRTVATLLFLLLYAYPAVKVHAQCTVNAGPDQTICAGGSVQLNGVSSGATTYLWTPALGLSNPNILNPIASPGTTTTYTLTASAPGSGGTDQSQITNTTCMAAFSQADLAQSFRPSVNSICGARIFITSGTGTGTVTIQLYNNLPNLGGTLLRSGSVAGIGASQWAQVSWTSASVTPGATYYLVFTCTNTSLCIGGNTSNPYPNGQVYANSGYGSFPTYDYTFETFGCGGAPTADQSQLSNTTCMANFSQTGLAQSFRPTANSICGASIFINSGSGTGNITLQLYNNLPNAGGVLMAQGTVNNIGANQWAQVSWSSVSVTPGATYYIVMTSTNGALCVAGNTSNPYPNGQVYANSGYGPFPTFDYTFETYTCAGGGCSVSDQVVVTVNPLPTVNAGPDLSICTGGSVTINATSSGATSYSWSPSAGLNNASILNPVASPGSTTTYTITASVGSGGGPVVDQTQTTNNTCMANFAQTDVAQSFKPTAPSICGARIFITSGTGTGDITIQLYNNLPNAGGVLMAQGTVTGIGISQWAQVAWPSVPVTPGTTYYLVFTSTNGNLCIGGNTSDPYPNGQVYANSGYGPFPTFDYTFETFTCGATCSASDAMVVTVGSAPTVNAGPDLTICAGGNVTLSGSGTASSYVWSPALGLSNPNILNPIASPGITTTYTLTGTNGGGGVDQSQLTNNTCMANFSQTGLAQSFIPTQNTICGARIFITSGSGTGDITIQLYNNLPNAGGVLMAQGTVTGIGISQWAQVSWGTTPVTPGVTYYLVLTSTNGNMCVGGNTANPYPGGQVYANAGYGPFPTFDYTFETFGCGSSCSGSDQMVVTVNPSPAANAGPDQTRCGTTTTLAGTVPSAGTGTWTIISGAGGSIASPNSASSNFTGVSGTTYTLRWTVTNPPCATVSDDVIISFVGSPTVANAGPDQAICGNSTTLAGNVPSTGSGLWTVVSGAGGSFTASSSPTSGFTGTAGVTYTLRWTISSPPCGTTFDDMLITPDVIFPTISCPANMSVSTSVGSCAAIVSYSTPVGADNCPSPVTTLIAGLSSGSTFPIGTTVNTFRVTDAAGHTSTCSFSVAVADLVPPTAVCQAITVNLNSSGVGTASAASVNNGSSDACGLAGNSLSPTTFACNNVGPNAVVLTVTDLAGNTSTCTTTATVRDNIAPNAICRDITVQLDNAGNATINPGFINNGTTDACGLANGFLNNSSFTCANIGTNTVILTAVDVNGNTGTCSGIVTVEDVTPPNAVCNNITVNLNSSGVGNTTAAVVGSGSSDACGLSNGSLSTSSFTCANLGPNPVTLTVTDLYGNISNCLATVTVRDVTPPVALCQNLTLTLGSSGTVTTSGSAFNNGSTDQCGIAGYSILNTVFNCANVGVNTIVMTVTDVGGNTATCTKSLTIIDNTAPAAVCQNTTVQLNAAGIGTISGVAMDNGSTDACGIGTRTPNPSTVTCANIGSPLSVVLTVADVNGNTSTCAAQVSAQDVTPPVAICQDLTLTLNNSGIATVTPSAVNNGSTDACGVGPMSLSLSTFSCANVGANTTVLTVTDINGNTGNCVSNIQILENTPPLVTCPANISVGTGANTCSAVVTWTTPSTSDNCGVPLLTTTLASGATVPAGTTNVTYTSTDGSGNTATCSFTITVTDNTPPVAICRNVTVNLNLSGIGSTSAGAVNNGSGDNCGISTLVLSQTGFTCANAGILNPVVLTATDANGNSSSCSANVTVVSPAITAVATATTNACGFNVSCNGASDGSASISATGGCPGFTYLWDNGATGTSTTGLNAGIHTVTVTDAGGGTSVATVTLTEPTPLLVTAGAINGSCSGDATGSAAIVASGGNSCAGGYAYLWSNGATTQNLSNVAGGTYTVTVTDPMGCTATQTVVVPVFSVPNPTINASGNVLTAGQTWVTYQWYLNGQPIPGATSITFTATTSGDYTLLVTDVNGCEGISTDIHLDIVGIQDNLDAWPSLSIHPNPTRDAFQLNTSAPIGFAFTVTINDMFGRKLYTQSFEELAHSATFDVQNLAAGNYLVEVMSAEGQRKVLRLVVQ